MKELFIQRLTNKKSKTSRPLRHLILVSRVRVRRQGIKDLEESGVGFPDTARVIDCDLCRRTGNERESHRHAVVIISVNCNIILDLWLSLGSEPREDCEGSFCLLYLQCTDRSY